jgi:LmeA-like phospholipid-binding
MSRPEENIFSEFTKMLLENQLDEARKIGVSIRTNLGKLFQGEIEGVSIQAQDLVKDEIQVQELEVKTDQISIDPLSALLGKVRLNEPIDSEIRLVLSEEDLNQNMNSEYGKAFLKPIELIVDREVITLELLPPSTIRLLDDNKMRFTGTVKIENARSHQNLAFTCIICPRTETEPVRLETFCCTPNDGQSIPFMIALLQWMESLLSQPYYEIEGVSFRVKNLLIQDNKLNTEIEIHAEKIPNL